MTRTLDLAHATTTTTTTTIATIDARAAAATTATAATAAAAPHGAGHRPCREVCARVFEFLDGELAPELAAAVRAHLAACGGCRRRVASDGALLAVVARAARSVEGSAPLSLRVRIHRALRSAERERESGAGNGAPCDSAPPSPAPTSAGRSRRRA